MASKNNIKTDKVYTFPVIIVVSQDGAKIAFLKKALKGSFHIVLAHEAEEALEIMSGMHADVIILDGKLPSAPILSFGRQIRSAAGYRDVPILLISNNLKKTFILEALNAGINDFLNEPLDTQEVYQRIAVAIKAQGSQKKISEVASRMKSTTEGKGAEIFRNRQLLNDRALKEISKAKKEGASLSILMIELDSYQELLTKWGDLVAEEVLVSLNALLNKHLRKFDVIIPQGGGKFILMLPKTSERAALLIAETVRKEVSSTLFNTKKKALSLTVSIGLVAWEKELFEKLNAYENFDRLLDTASHFLGEAKKRGNQIVSKTI